MRAGRGARESRLWPLLAAALCAAGCGTAAPGLEYASGAGSVTADGLQRVRWSQLGAQFVRPGAQLAGYDKVLLEPLSISTAKDEERRRMGPVKQYPPTASFLDTLRRVYQETFSKQFSRGGFSVVDAPGPGVLRISGHVADLVLTAKLDPEQDTTTTELVTSFGDLTLLLDVRDSVSGEPLMRTVDRQPISQTPLVGAVRNSTGANIGAQREVFAHEALLLRGELAQLRKLGTLPAAPVAANPRAPAPAGP